MKETDQKSDEKQACDFNRAAAKEGLRLKTLPSLYLSSISKKLKICWKITVTLKYYCLILLKICLKLITCFTIYQLYLKSKMSFTILANSFKTFLRLLAIKKILEYSLTLSWRRFFSYRNQSINLQSKSMVWVLYYRDSVLKELRILILK